MIPKASQRGGGQHLATHLLNEFDNDRVEFASVRGAVAQDLHGAFAEWRALAKVTQCRKYLYSLSVNPDPQQGPLTRDQYADFVARVEKKLGLAEQPRAVVFHVKYGREHCHVVWSRIDPDNLRAVQLSHDRQKLRSVVRDFARDHGLALPQGLKEDRGADRYRDRKKVVNLAEKQQEERTGETKEERRAAITAAWQAAQTGAAFVAALERNGYSLARGDARAYVVVDRFGEIHSLARQIDGARARDVAARLKDYPAERLPEAAKIQETLRKKRASDHLRRAFGEAASGETVTQRGTLSLEQRRADLTALHAKRRAELKSRREALEKTHAEEREALREAQKAENDGVTSERLLRKPKGLRAFLTRITGIQFVIDRRNRKQDDARAAHHRQQTEALERRHSREMLDFKRHDRAMASVAKRELASLTRLERRARLRAGVDAAKRPPGRPPLPGAADPRTQPHEKTTPQQETKSSALRSAYETAQNPARKLQTPQDKPRPETPDDASAARRAWNTATDPDAKDKPAAYDPAAEARRANEEALRRKQAQGPQRGPGPDRER